MLYQLPVTPAPIGHVEIPEEPAPGAVLDGAELGLPLVQGIFFFLCISFRFFFLFSPRVFLFFLLNPVSASFSVHFMFGLFRFLVLFSKELAL